MSRAAVRPLRSLDREVRGAFRVMLFGITLILVLAAGGFGWVVMVNQPQLTTLENSVDAAQGAHLGLVGEESSIRGYIATGDPTYLETYRAAVVTVAANDLVLNRAFLNPTVTSRLLDFRLAQQAWTDWAEPRATPADRDRLLGASGQALDPARVAADLSAGSQVFNAYQVTQRALVAQLRAERERVQEQQRQAIGSLFIAIFAICFALAAFAGVRRRRLKRHVIVPFQSLIGTVEDVAEGRLLPPAELVSATEIVELRDGLAAMVTSLSDQRSAAIVKSELADLTARRLRDVLTFAREMSGSLSTRYVLDTVTTAACATTESERARVWLVDETSGALRLAFDSRLGRKVAVEAVDCPMGLGAVGRSAKYGQVSYSGDLEGDSLADGAGESVVGFPLIVGARVVGVLEIQTEPHQRFDEELLELIETIASHSAAALEAARLYQDSETLSSSDALTGLANRRRLDTDLATEVELALRHNRPLALIMFDLDHFKKVNDTYGHQQGDQVLQDVAAILRSEARPGDTMYRYGGEELAVVVRESDAEGAVQLAERLRASVEKRFTRAGAVTQTMSGGVASIPAHASSASGLIAAADAALYVAKQTGRNRVVLSGVAEAVPAR